jgi:hypothetical protein
VMAWATAAASWSRWRAGTAGSRSSQVVGTGLEDEQQRDTAGPAGQQAPVLIGPDARPVRRARPTVPAIFADAGRLGKFGRGQRDHAQAVRLEREDVPARHARQRQAALRIAGAHRAAVELIGSHWHHARIKASGQTRRGGCCQSAQAGRSGAAARTPGCSRR